MVSLSVEFLLDVTLASVVVVVRLHLEPVIIVLAIQPVVPPGASEAERASIARTYKTIAHRCTLL